MEEKKYKILLCEDDTNLGAVLKNYLELNDYDVTLERDGRLGLAAFQRSKPDICLLDVMMPNMDGFTLAEEIRDIDPDVPLFFLSAKTMKDDIIQGYKLGADDYITKPFDSDVLMLKIKAILKRNEELNKESDNMEFDLGGYHFNPKLRQLILKGKAITLSPKENELLKMLAENKNDLLSQIMDMEGERDIAITGDVLTHSENAIDELMGYARHGLAEFTKVMSCPTIVYDLQKYYRELWDKFETDMNKRIYEGTKHNIARGQKEGLYREGIDADIIAKLYVKKMMAIMDEDTFPTEHYNKIRLFTQFLIYHVHGIATPKGIALFDMKLKALIDK